MADRAMAVYREFAARYRVALRKLGKQMSSEYYSSALATLEDRNQEIHEAVDAYRAAVVAWLREQERKLDALAEAVGEQAGTALALTSGAVGEIATQIERGEPDAWAKEQS